MTKNRYKRIKNADKFQKDDWTLIDGTKNKFELVPLGPGQDNHTTFLTEPGASPSYYVANLLAPELLLDSMEYLLDNYPAHWQGFPTDIGKIYECLSIVALILADHHKGGTLPDAAVKIVVEGDLTQSIENARSYFQKLTGQMPVNEKLIRKFISGFYIPTDLVEDLNKNLKKPVLKIGRELSLDEKVRKITSFDSRVKNAKGLGTWTSLAGVRDIYGQSYIVDIHTNECVIAEGEHFTAGENVERCAAFAKDKGGSGTVSAFDSWYSGAESSAILDREKIFYAHSVHPQRFSGLVAMLKDAAPLPGQWAALYNHSKKLIFLKTNSTVNATGIKHVLGNCVLVSSGRVRIGEIVLSDAYKCFFPIIDYFNRQMTEEDRKGWPFRHGDSDIGAVNAHLFKYYFEIVIQNSKVLWGLSENKKAIQHWSFLENVAVGLFNLSKKFVV